MYLQETYISDEEALDIVLEYLWNEYDYETEEELYEAYDFLTDEEFEYILNEGLFDDLVGAGRDAIRGGVESFRKRRKASNAKKEQKRAVKNFNNFKGKVVQKPGTLTKDKNYMTVSAPKIADRVVPSASKQDKTSSVVPVKFGNKVRRYGSGERKATTSTVVPVGNFAAPKRAAGEVAKIRNEDERVKREKETKNELRKRKNADKRAAKQEKLNNLINTKRQKRRRRKKNSALNNLPAPKKAQTQNTNKLHPLDKKNIVSKAPTVKTSKAKPTVAGKLRRDDFTGSPKAGPTAGAVLARMLDGNSPIGTSNKKTKSGKRKKVSGPAKREQVKQALRSYDRRMYDRLERNRKARQNG